MSGIIKAEKASTKVIEETIDHCPTCGQAQNSTAQIELLKKDLKIAKAVAENNVRTLIREVNELRKMLDLLDKK